MELLERLINAHGVSGNESQVRQVIRKEITPLVDEVWTDSAGNLVARESGRRPRFMLSAHMDEIGLMVREITSNGLLLCAAVGGVNPVAMIGTRVTVEGTRETVHGLVTTREISCGYDVEELPNVEDLVVDTSLTKDQLLKQGVTVGSFLEPAKETNWLVHGNTISGKALDNRVGCYILIEVARQLRRSKQDVYFAFTVQEEIGLYGAKTSAFAIRPNWAIVVDVTPAVDLAEDADSKATSISIGKGPCLLHMDESFIADARLNREIMKVAEKCDVKLQHEVSSFGTTDATNISTVRRGVPSSTISVPVRNVHSTLEIADRRDIDAAIRVLSAMLKDPPAALRRRLSTMPQTRRVRRAARTAAAKVTGKKEIGRKPGKAPGGKPKKKRKKKGKPAKKRGRKVPRKPRGPKARRAAKKKARAEARARRKAKARRAKRAAASKSKKKPKRRLKSRRSASGRPRRARPQPKPVRRAARVRKKRR